MPQIIVKKKNKKGIVALKDIENYYRSKYFAMFMNKFEITGMSDDQARFFLTQMWEVGTINAFILKGSKPSSLVLEDDMSDKEGLLVITPYAPRDYNIYNYPTKLQAVNTRGATFIPQVPMTIGKDCVIGWAHTSHTPIRYIVDYYCTKIAEVESTINTNLFAHKMPRLVITSPEDEDRVKEIMNKIESGDSQLFLSVEDWQSVKNVLDGGATYIIDKLYTYKQNLENELLTILGIDNKGDDKKERLLVDEVNANNDAINQGSDSFMTEMDKFTKQVKDILGYTLTIKVKQNPVRAVSETMPEDNTEEYDNDTSED